MGLLQTAERISPHNASDNYVYQRSVLAYLEAAKIVSGKVLEIGTGTGYGLEIIAPKVEFLLSVDKYSPPVLQRDFLGADKIKFMEMSIPPLSGIVSNTLDFVITFQVIEHVEKDELFLKEIHRVLKRGGKLILTTPNSRMSLSRNPWHVREYTADELKNLMQKYFSIEESFGVFGNQLIMEYFEKNKKSVETYAKFDIFNLQHRLPRPLFKIPYDILNRINRHRLLRKNGQLVNDISHVDYFIDEANDHCFDLFYIAAKI